MELEITINKYINGELSGASLAEFKTLLEKDTALQEEVQFHREVDAALSINEEVENNENLKSLLSNLGKKHIQEVKEKTHEPAAEKAGGEIIANPEIFPENKSNLKKLNPYLLLAAAAAFLLFMFLPSLQNESNSTIADNRFQLFELDDTTLGSDNSEDLYKKAKSYYENGKYEEAKNQFNLYLQTKPNVPKILLAKGCAEFKLTELDAAIKSFKQVLVAAESDIYQPTAYWYLALSYLKKEDQAQAIKHLKAIQKGQDYFKDAQQLLKQF